MFTSSEETPLIVYLGEVHVATLWKLGWVVSSTDKGDSALTLCDLFLCWLFIQGQTAGIVWAPNRVLLISYK